MRKEVRTVSFNSDLRLRLANERIRARVIDAANDRLSRAEQRNSFRHQLGHQIIRIGARLAEDQHLSPARSR
jgi:hypothetical protein